MSAPPKGLEGALCLAFSGGRLLVREGEGFALPTLGEVEGSGLAVRYIEEVGSLRGRPCTAVELDLDAEAPEGMESRDFRAMMGAEVDEEVDEEFFHLAGLTRQVVDWHRNNRFCGRCGAKTEESKTERAMVCPECGLVNYPKISPAAIVLIRNGERALLARSPGFPPGVYSTLAGFVEVGESVEETIRREIREEVGVEVDDLRYFGSQSWPFPDSLMLGFIARYAGGEIHDQSQEIEASGWFTATELPTLPPPMSIARRLLETFIEESKTEESKG